MDSETSAQAAPVPAPAAAPATVLIAARRELERLPRVLPVLLASLDDAAWRARPASGRWSPLEIICHLRDEEQDDFGARVRLILDGKPEFAPIDPEGWVEARRYRAEDPHPALAAFAAGRGANLDLLGRIEPDRLARSAVTGGGFRLSGLDILAAWVAHDLLHLRQLAGTLARLWATRYAPLHSGYAGPLPYPEGESKG